MKLNINEEKAFVYSMMKEITEERRRLTDIYYDMKKRLDDLDRLEIKGVEELSLQGMIELHDARKTALAVANIQRESLRAIEKVQQDIKPETIMANLASLQQQVMQVTKQSEESQQMYSQQQTTQAPQQQTFFNQSVQAPVEKSVASPIEKPLASPTTSSLNPFSHQQAFFTSPVGKPVNAEKPELVSSTPSQEEMERDEIIKKIEREKEKAIQKIQSEVKDTTINERIPKAEILKEKEKAIVQAKVAKTYKKAEKPAKPAKTEKSGGQVSFKKVAEIVVSILKEAGKPVKSSDLFEELNKHPDVEVSAKNFSNNIMFRIAKENPKIDRAMRGYYQYMR